jgi:predicted nucleic acid-binding protein
MILVDACVVIDCIEKPDLRVIEILESIQPWITGVIRAEVLAGGNTPSKWLRIYGALDDFYYLTFPDSLWDEVARNQLKLRSAGYKFPFNDVVSATLAIDSNCELWTRDKQFGLIQKVLPQLRLFVELP